MPETPTTTPTKTPYFLLKPDKAGWRWEFRTAHHKILAVSFECYASEKTCRAAVRRFYNYITSYAPE